ncbi:hypothetical protein KC960_02260 [Candidatus Saccharibacteria bacterium]|nr:hypothetical protein [Candidatus Saccharibacteria bacterium]
MKTLLFDNPNVIEVDGEIMPYPGNVIPENPHKVNAELFKDHPMMAHGNDQDADIVISSEALYVDLEVRNNLLGSALTNLASASRLGGLLTLAENEEYPGMRRKLEIKYEDVDSLSGRSQDRQKTYMDNAKKDFLSAYGLDSNELVDDEKQRIKLKTDAERSFTDFVKKFGDAKGAKARAELRKKLAKQAKAIKKKNEKA